MTLIGQQIISIHPKNHKKSVKTQVNKFQFSCVWVEKKMKRAIRNISNKGK